MYMCMYTHKCYNGQAQFESKGTRYLRTMTPVSHPGDNMRLNSSSQKWKPLRMLSESGSIPRKLSKYLPSTRLQGGVPGRFRERREQLKRVQHLSPRL